jgi:hypothetical protein
VIRLEVREPGPGAQRDRGRARVQRIGKPAVAPIAVPPAKREPPEAGVQGVRIPQRIEIDPNHFDAGGAEEGEVGRPLRAVDVVDGIDEQQDLHARLGTPLFDERVAQLTGECAVRRR